MKKRLMRAEVRQAQWDPRFNALLYAAGQMFQVPLAQIVQPGSRRTDSLVAARQLVALILRDEFNLTLESIAILLGYQDSTGVIVAIRTAHKSGALDAESIDRLWASACKLIDAEVVAANYSEPVRAAEVSA